MLSPQPSIPIKERIDAVCLEGEGRLRFFDGGLKKVASFTSRYNPNQYAWLVELDIPFKETKVLKFYWKDDPNLKSLSPLFELYHHKNLNKKVVQWEEKSGRDFVLFNQDLRATFSHWSEQGFFKRQSFQYRDKTKKDFRLELFFASCHKS